MNTDHEIDAEADTLEQAIGVLRSKIQPGFHPVSEQLISDGKPQTSRATADTVESAFAIAQEGVADTDIIEKKVIIAPEERSITVQAFDESMAETEAKEELRRQFANAAKIQEIRLRDVGSKGFFGLGKKPNQYEVQILPQAQVEVSYRTKAKISVRLIPSESIRTSRCMICGNPLEFEQPRGMAVTFGDPFEALEQRIAYRCRNCGTLICMKHAKTHRCSVCDQNTFDRALR